MRRLKDCVTDTVVFFKSGVMYTCQLQEAYMEMYILYIIYRTYVAKC